MFAKNDEEKRNRLWKTAISVSTLVIILIAVFFVIKLFTSNPLEGTWVREDSDLMLTISGEYQAVVQYPVWLYLHRTPLLLSAIRQHLYAE